MPKRLLELQCQLETLLFERLRLQGFERELERVAHSEAQGRISTKQRADDITRFALQLNNDTTFFFYPGETIDGKILRLDPLIGLENSVLRELAKNSEEASMYFSDGRVCHKFLTLYGNGETIELHSVDSVKGLALSLCDLIESLALPEMSRYDTVQKVIMLLRSYIAGDWCHGIAILDPHLKLELLESHSQMV